MGIGVKRQELVQNGVTDLVGDFVGMTFRHALGREKIIVLTLHCITKKTFIFVENER
jgi:hypothetical protein